jgi:dipeptide/tripeptide permease
MLVYVMSIPGGIIADKFLGQKKSVMIGALLLVAGHGILAVENITAFYSGLFLIVLGVGLLKPNISTMVGGLYPKGDERRDKGFTLFYIGINVGAFLAAIIVGYVGEEIGWHYGFGLAGIGMLLGLMVYMWGQKYLSHVGNFLGSEMDEEKRALMKAPLNAIEKDRMKVLFISFLIIIIFWGAFEQAGGLLNLYAKEKVNRMFGSWEMPASWFQSFNAGFIIIFGSAVAAFWANRKLKGKESSTLLKMGIGTIIMGAGFLLMGFASKEAGSITFGTASFWWLTAAYLLHTIGELFASPTALSFITKLAPVKYASIMMGVYFAATGLGNKLAGSIGEASQSEPIKIEFVADMNDLKGFNRADTLVAKDAAFEIKADLYEENGQIVTLGYENKQAINNLFSLTTPTAEQLEDGAKSVEEKTIEIVELLKSNEATKASPYHAKLKFEKDFEAKKVKANIGDGQLYSGEFIIEEIQTEKEYSIFMFIFYLTLAFGLIVVFLLKPLKRLTHGAEDLQGTSNDETEGFELADKE